MLTTCFDTIEMNAILHLRAGLFPFCYQEFSLLNVVQTGSGVHPNSYPVGTGGSFLGGKATGREVDNSPLASPEVKKMWIYTPTPPYAFMV
jgi:hypothetical protein